MKDNPTCSLIILAYNEEKNIASCLEAIARQSRMPDEVLVINNNSTDRTAEIANTFPFVRVVNESTQGMIPARNRGFSEATGDILMRIDADTIINDAWVETIYRLFLNSSVQCVTGPSIASWPTFTGSALITLWFSKLYFIWGRAMFGTPLAWGANMALKRSAWEKIKQSLCLDGDIVHEDQDISLWLAKYKYSVTFDSRLFVTSDWKSLEYIPTIYKYAKKRYSTSQWHWHNNGFVAPWWTLGYRLAVLLLLAPFYIIYGLFIVVCTLLITVKHKV